MSTVDDVRARIRAAISSDDFNKALAMLPEFRRSVEEQLRSSAGEPEELRSETVGFLQWALRSVASSREHTARRVAVLPSRPLYDSRSRQLRARSLETEG